MLYKKASASYLFNINRYEADMISSSKILLGITGGIAAYKAVELASLLTRKGAQVKTIMTANATEFISPLTVKSITHQPVITRYFNPEADIEHISLADWADLLVIAPATANIIGKVAGGIADDLLSTTIMATTAPVLFVPAMNVHMYENPIVQDNIRKLSGLGYFFAEPETGELACGYRGKGRFPAPSEISFYIETYLKYKRDLSEYSFLITTGACREKIDPMRFISNYSSGRMGLAIARAAYLRGADVHLIAGVTSVPVPPYLKTTLVTTAAEFHQAVMEAFPASGITVMAAAISDYTPANPSSMKIKKGNDLQLPLQRTKDVLEELGRIKKPDQLLIGFAAESENLRDNAQLKMKKKNLDLIVANNLNTAGREDTEVLILGKNFEEDITGSKFFVAHRLLDLIINGK